MVNSHMMELLRDMAVLFPAFLIVFTFRGLARALIAKWMGDHTAYHEGFVSLNPLMHVDIMGLTLVLLVVYGLSYFIGGRVPHSMLYVFLIFMGVRWIYPVPYEPRNFRNLKRGMILTILGGSLGCFFLVFVLLYAQKYLPFNMFAIGVARTLRSIISTVVMLAAYFGVLALIPIPPFDGGKLLEFVLPYSKRGIIQWLEEYSLFILLALFLLPVVSDVFFGLIGLFAIMIVKLLSMLVF